MPLYLVKQSVTQGHDKTSVERLVDAPNKASAVKHVAKDSIKVEVVDHNDLIRLTKEGVNVENAE